MKTETETKPTEFTPEFIPGALVRHQPQSESERLIQLAIEQKVTVETMERLLAMRDKLKAESAAEAFNRAMADFQARCPAIPKTKKAGTGNFTYHYAPLDVIKQAIGPLLAECGLSYSFDTEDSETHKTTICSVRHVAGHKEQSRFRVPIDKGARMNDTQKEGSASTYAKRYALENALGIHATDDDDGASSSKGAAGHPAPRPAPVQTPQAEYGFVDDGDHDLGPQKATSKPATPDLEQPRTFAVASRVPTDKHRDRMVARLIDMFGDQARVKEYAVAAGFILETETLLEWPLCYVPVSPEQMDMIEKAVARFFDGEDAIKPFTNAMRAPKGKGVSVPRDTHVDPSSDTAAWRSFQIPFGKDKGTRLDKMDKKVLYGWWAGFECSATFVAKDGTEVNKSAASMAKDRILRQFLDEAGKHYEFTKEAKS